MMLRDAMLLFAKLADRPVSIPSIISALEVPQLPNVSEKIGKCLSTTCCAASSCFLVLAALLAPSARAQSGETEDKTESPYFQIANDDSGVDALPLKSTEVDVRISGVIADVTVTQTYRNEGNRPIEARYVFPGSTRAAVHAMNVRLADRLIAAKIREKQQAKKEYEQAKTEGKTAALLEQHRPNVFQTSIANIMPGDDVKVELHYTELLTQESARYQFVFPTVVGPRYNSPQSDSAGEKWIAQPTLRKGVDSPAKFDIRVALDTPISLKEVDSPSHKLDLGYSGDKHVDIQLGKNPGRADNNRDFILNYRLAGDKVESGVMLMRGHGENAENFFLAMVEPPKAVPPSVILPRDYIFVVDVSGSMHGFPLETAKTLLNELIGGLRPDDTFNVLLFESNNAMLYPNSIPATRENINKALRLIDQHNGRGGTELIPALQNVYAQAKPKDMSRTIVLVTDGYVTVESEAFNLVRKHLGESNLFAFGIGSSVNRHLIEGLARAGMSEPFVITDGEQAPKEAARFRQMIASPVLTQVHANFEGVKTYDVVPQNLPDVLAERPIILFGKWHDQPGSKLKQLVIDGHRAGGSYQQILPLFEALNEEEERFSALRHLWARQRIAELSDQEILSSGHREEITALGLKYSLLTQYTSFVAVEERVRNPRPGDAVTIDQPQPLPEGVSESAVGGFSFHIPSSPEPKALGALFVALSMLAMIARRLSRQRRHHMTL